MGDDTWEEGRGPERRHFAGEHQNGNSLLGNTLTEKFCGGIPGLFVGAQLEGRKNLDGVTLLGHCKNKGGHLDEGNVLGVQLEGVEGETPGHRYCSLLGDT